MTAWRGCWVRIFQGLLRARFTLASLTCPPRHPVALAVVEVVAIARARQPMIVVAVVAVVALEAVVVAAVAVSHLVPA